MASPTDPTPEGGDVDDEALTWAGDEEQGRRRPRLAAPDPAEESTLESAGDDEDQEFEPPATPRDVPGAALAVVFGILYLAITVGWIYSVQLTAAPSADLFPEVVWQFGEFTAMVAAPIWFAAVIALTRDRPALRAGWFALGVGLLLPWPVLLGLAG
ncbi:hypothetical protein GCM10009840_15200 [Pseudolysinimonas kribbensis]|uniref:DNA polymerase III subunit gamma/tau n=1 Tax=Pseudolysinimonas kribbensis TaxID=433641 RepID=A0ABQ6K0L9_9MICO|nr:hypothetical protein [Pseudolysinimonas kribbensis]GMA94140.1 hypothetical protein GCM10025881_09640 [Pseudolysinimonas kribbensis]